MRKHHIVSTLFPAAVLLAGAAWAVPPQESPMSREPENTQQHRIPEDQTPQSDDAVATDRAAVRDPTTPTGTPAVSMAAIKSNFDAFDKNGDGYISKDEASSDARLVSQFNTLDADHDGKLSVTEFMSAANVAEFRPQRGLERE